MKTTMFWTSKSKQEKNMVAEDQKVYIIKMN